MSLSNTSIIIGGDWNVIQDFSFDTDNYLHKNNLKSHDKVLEISSYLDLIGVWRKMNTEERRFTWHGPSRKQSRLDYFLISSDLEGFIKRSEIGLSYRSDHSPMSVSFQFHNQERGRGTWKFNNSLLYDPDYVTLVKNCIHEVILQYSVPTLDEDLAFSINDQLLWEIIKMTIRGKTIAFASHKKGKEKKGKRN